MRFLFFCLLFFCLTQSAFAARKNSERHYQEQWAKEHGGKIEVTLPDKTRCDIVTKDFAIEVDFADKWSESIGQALYYAFQTNKKPAVLLIMEDQKDRRFLFRLNSVLVHYKIDIEVFVVRNY